MTLRYSPPESDAGCRQSEEELDRAGGRHNPDRIPNPFIRQGPDLTRLFPLCYTFLESETKN